MKIGQTHKGCRYWGYEPVSAELVAGKRDEKMNKYDRAAIKAAGMKPKRFGFRSIFPARMAALKIEKATGVEMRVFNHDYL